MKLKSRKVLSYMANSLIFIVVLLIIGLNDVQSLVGLIGPFFTAQLANTALFLGANWADKRTQGQRIAFSTNEALPPNQSYLY